jgi:hypothetical protein
MREHTGEEGEDTPTRIVDKTGEDTPTKMVNKTGEDTLTLAE